MSFGAFMEGLQGGVKSGQSIRREKQLDDIYDSARRKIKNEETSDDIGRESLDLPMGDDTALPDPLGQRIWEWGKGLFAAVSANPVRKIVLTQSHANQYGGLEVYKTPENEVIAHRLYPAERADAEALSAHYRRGSRRIFGAITGRTEDMVPTVEVTPDR